MSSRRGGRGGRNPKDLPREQQVSRKVSWLLRHGAGQEGLTLGEGGYVNVQDALNTRALRTLNITFSELRTIVATNDKQRFSMVPTTPLLAPSPETAEPTPDPESEQDAAKYLIRANQGHSIKLATTGLLTPITPAAANIPPTVIHGTDAASWRLILLSGGLRRMTRNHIHFAAGLPPGFQPRSTTDEDAPAGVAPKETTAPPVISGMRSSSAVVIYVDIVAALEAGVEFFLSDNGVVLTAGNEDGVLGYEFFKRVESRGKYGTVLMENGVLPDGVEVNVEEWEREIGGGKRGGQGGRGKGGKGRGRGRGKSGDGRVKVNDDTGGLLAGVLRE